LETYLYFWRKKILHARLREQCISLKAAGMPDTSSPN
jgi:hypothetical protein